MCLYIIVYTINFKQMVNKTKVEVPVFRSQLLPLAPCFNDIIDKKNIVFIISSILFI